MRHGCRALVPILCAALLAGCGANRRQELLENELRLRDLQHREALDELFRSESRADALSREAAALRQGGVSDPNAFSHGVQRIALGRLTGGIDRDGVPGDELLHVVVEPQDYAGHAIKATGTLQIFALQIEPGGVKVPLSTWIVPEEKLAAAWKQGLLNIGYHIELPWQKFPTCEQLRVVARLTTREGRVFETDKDIKVRPLPGLPHPDFANPAGGVVPLSQGAAGTTVRAGHQSIAVGRPTPLNAIRDEPPAP